MPVLLFGGGAGHTGDNIAIELEGVAFARVESRVYAFNTDEEDLDELHTDILKCTIGPTITGGWGAGADPQNGYNAAVESEKEILAPLQDADIAIFVAALGGGTGSGSIPFAVEKYTELMKNNVNVQLHERKAGVIIVTLPFDSQDEIIKGRADAAYKKLFEYGLPIIPIPCDKFLPVDADLTTTSIKEMFAMGDKLIARMIARMIRSLGQRHDRMNIDRNDIVSHLLIDPTQLSPMSYFNTGYAKEGESIEKALEMAATSPLLGTTLAECRKVIVSVDVQDGTVDDWNKMQIFQQKHRLDPNAEWRLGLNDSYKPLAFEEKEGYNKAVFIIGVGCSSELSIPVAANSELDVEPARSLSLVRPGETNEVVPRTTHISSTPADIMSAVDNQYSSAIGKQ